MSVTNEPAGGGFVLAWCENCQTYIWRGMTPEEIEFERKVADRNRAEDDSGWMFAKY